MFVLSRASLHSPASRTKKSLLIDRKAVQRLSRTVGTKHLTQEATGEQTDGDQKVVKKTHFKLFRQGDKKSATVYPDNTGDDAEKGVPSTNNDRLSWLGSNEVQTGTLSSQGNKEMENSDKDLTRLIDELSENEKNWDILVEVHEKESSLLKPKPSRRTTFCVEWAPTNDGLG